MSTNRRAAQVPPPFGLAAERSARIGMKKLAKVIRRDDLLKLPCRAWDAAKTYDFLYIVPTRKKHDSGYSLIAIVGVCLEDSGAQWAEIAAYCDDVCWTFPTAHPYDRIREGQHHNIMRTDCLFPSGIFRIWGSGEHYFTGRFRIGAALSSTTVELVVWPRGDGRNQMTGQVIAMPSQP